MTTVEGITSRERLLAQLLLRNAQFHISYNRGFSNHLSHVLISLYFLGASEHRLRYIYSEYVKRLFPALPLEGPTITEENWREFLGQKDFYREYLLFFLEQERKCGLAKVLETYVPPLISGFPASAFHPLIQIGYGLQLLHYWQQQKWSSIPVPEGSECCNATVAQVFKEEQEAAAAAAVQEKDEVEKLAEELPNLALDEPELAEIENVANDEELLEKAAIFAILQGVAYIAMVFQPFGELQPLADQGNVPVSVSSRVLHTSGGAFQSVPHAAAGTAATRKNIPIQKEDESFRMPMDLFREMAKNETFGPDAAGPRAICIPRDQLFMWRIQYFAMYYGNTVLPQYDTRLSRYCTAQDLIDAAATLYEESNDDFFMLHCVTASFCYKVLEFWLPPHVAYDARRHLFRSIAAVYVTRVLDNANVPQQEGEMVPETWSNIVRRAVAELEDVHSIKMVFVSRHEACQSPITSNPPRIEEESELVSSVRRDMYRRIATLQLNSERGRSCDPETAKLCHC